MITASAAKAVHHLRFDVALLRITDVLGEGVGYDMRDPIALVPADPLTVRPGAIGWASDGLRATFATTGAADYRGVTKGAGARWYGSPADRDFS